MANRNFNRRQALEKEVKDLYARVSVAGSGAPTLVSPVGVASISRNGAGDYSLTLQDKYASLKFFEGVHLVSSGEDLSFQIHSETVASTKIIRFLTLAGATPTDPSNGAVLLLKFELKNTSVI